MPPSQRPLPHWRNSALLRVLRLCSLVLLQSSVPVVLLPVWAPAVLPSVVLWPDLSLAFRPVAARTHLRASSPVDRAVSMVLADCMVSSVAARPIFRAIEGRAAAYSANGYSRNSYTNYGYGYGYGRGYRHAYTAPTATAAYAYGRADASSDDGCYYVSAYRRYGTRRVLVCHED